MSIDELRREYSLHGLSEADVASDPVEQFQLWFAQAVAARLPEPNAMTLATATTDGKPSARIVLLKHWDAHGFVFYTNYNSRKGRELLANPWAALVLFWPELERQVRIEGQIAQATPSESDAYFASRPLGSRLGAWVSPQSEPIAERTVLEIREQEISRRFADGDIPRPPHWGGFRLMPTSVEFWQGRPNRLHDRLRYHRIEDSGWLLERLAP